MRLPSAVGIFLVICSLLVTGCVLVPVPLSSDYRSSDVLVSSTRLSALRGKAIDQVIADVGEPAFRFNYQDSEYLIYRIKGKEYRRDFEFTLPIPIAAVIGDYTYDALNCVLLEFSAEGIFHDYQASGWITGQSCIEKFWGRPERQVLRSALIEAASVGDVNAAIVLVEEFRLTDAEVVSIRLREGASKGDLHAARLLAVMFDEWEPFGQLAEIDPLAAQEMDRLTQAKRASPTSVAGLGTGQVAWLAVQGDAEAQLQMYWNTLKEDVLAAHRWLCLSAEQGHPEARYRIATLYEFGSEEVLRNDVSAFIWYTLAAESGHIAAKKARSSIANRLTNEQNHSASRMVSTWRPGHCYVDLH